MVTWRTPPTKVWLKSSYIISFPEKCQSPVNDEFCVGSNSYLQSTKGNISLMIYYFIMEYWLLIDQGRIHQNGCSQRQAFTSTRSSEHASDFFKMTRDRTTWGFLCSWCIRTAGCMRRTRWWTFCLRSAWPPQSSRPLLPPSEKPRDKTRTNR